MLLFVWIFVLYIKVTCVKFFSHMPPCKLLEGKSCVFTLWVSSSALKMVNEKKRVDIQ